jgi:two-component system phosphate regulon sensor histidine kinase PhoR
MAENLESGIVSDPARGREYHRLIADECSRLGALIENVLDLARIERNGKTYEFTEVDVPALITDTVRLLQPRAGQRRQEIRNESAPLDPSPVCDGMAIQQALINLLDNAIKFAPEHTVIVIRAKIEGAAHWLLEVVDQGPGIPEREHAKIFERFYRIGSELRRETRGTGIGLTIVKHIAEGHRGTISVANHPSGGATFTLRLPLQPRSPLSTI